MKQAIAVLLCLLLCGCTRPTLSETTQEASVVPAQAAQYHPDHPVEKAYPGQVKAYLLTLRDVKGIRAIGKDVLVFSGQDNTTLTLLTGQELQEKVSLTLTFPLLPEDSSLQIHENGISYFDPLQPATIVLDHRLQEIRRIAAPEGLSGKPILSSEMDTLYYCTGISVVAWDLKSGIRRTVKELSHEAQELTQLHGNDRILECTVEDKGKTSKLLLSADQGVEIRTLPEEALLHIGDSTFFLALPAGYQTLPIFGKADASTELLLPKHDCRQPWYLAEDHAVIAVCDCAEGIQLDYYELNTGILRASMKLGALQSPKSIINSKDHAVYILAYDSEADCDVLFRWDVLRQAPDPTNTTVYKVLYHSSENPDLEALKDCQEYADTIGRKYGITLWIWEDAVAVQPWDYRFQPEHLAPVLQKELTLLDQRLAQYPEAVLQQTKDHFTGLTICLVRQISGTGDNSSLNTATGIQFFEKDEAYVVITVGKYSEQALYHELYHVMETHILAESTALDSWESLNPAGFVYGSEERNQDIYLQGQTRAFVDRYSMGSAREDRARVLENAMLQDKKDLFPSEYMQRKLNALCVGIREAYGLKKDPQILPWEQYLINPLTPRK